MSLLELRTGRILLRPWTREDIPALHELWTAPEVRRFLWDDIVIPPETAVQVVESHLATSQEHGFGYWALHIPPSQSLIGGFCGFRFVNDGPDVELMYGLRGEHWAQGLAAEACSAALSFFWRATDHDQIYARTDPPNERSIRGMVRLGMTHVSTTPTMVTYVLRRSGLLHEPER